MSGIILLFLVSSVGSVIASHLHPVDNGPCAAALQSIQDAAKPRPIEKMFSAYFILPEKLEGMFKDELLHWNQAVSGLKLNYPPFCEADVNNAIQARVTAITDARDRRHLSDELYTLNRDVKDSLSTFTGREENLRLLERIESVRSKYQSHGQSFSIENEAEVKRRAQDSSRDGLEQTLLVALNAFATDQGDSEDLRKTLNRGLAKDVRSFEHKWEMFVSNLCRAFDNEIRNSDITEPVDCAAICIKFFTDQGFQSVVAERKEQLAEAERARQELYRPADIWVADMTGKVSDLMFQFGGSLGHPQTLDSARLSELKKLWAGIDGEMLSGLKTLPVSGEHRNRIRSLYEEINNLFPQLELVKGWSRN